MHLPSSLLQVLRGLCSESFCTRPATHLQLFQISCGRLGKEEAGDVRDASPGTVRSDFTSVPACRLRSAKSSSRLRRGVGRGRAAGCAFCSCGRRSLGKGQSWDKLASCLASNSSSSQQIGKCSAVHGLAIAAQQSQPFGGWGKCPTFGDFRTLWP